jgi:hypothetical protein
MLKGMCSKIPMLFWCRLFVLSLLLSHQRYKAEPVYTERKEQERGTEYPGVAEGKGGFGAK